MPWAWEVGDVGKRSFDCQKGDDGWDLIVCRENKDNVRWLYVSLNKRYHVRHEKVLLLIFPLVCTWCAQRYLMMCYALPHTSQHEIRCSSIEATLTKRHADSIQTKAGNRVGQAPTSWRKPACSWHLCCIKAAFAINLRPSLENLTVYAAATTIPKNAWTEEIAAPAPYLPIASPPTRGSSNGTYLQPTSEHKQAAAKHKHPAALLFFSEDLAVSDKSFESNLDTNSIVGVGV